MFVSKDYGYHERRADYVCKEGVASEVFNKNIEIRELESLLIE
jgi:hypothetical protein